MRAIKTISLKKDFVVVGGGLSGVCAAVTAARGGIQVALIQDRPILGGNASSEVRLWPLGATSHMGNNNRWSREGGVIDEIVLENLYRNKEGNPVFFDMVLFDLVQNEPNIQLLLNTAVHDVSMQDNDHIGSIKAYNSRSETAYIIEGDFFCDASGDGILGYLSGARLLKPADNVTTKDSLQYPESFGATLGSSLFFYTKKVDNPVSYKAPSFALDTIEHIGRIDKITLESTGCDYWWIEWGGKLDTIHDDQEITQKLWGVVYGVWNYIKNSGKFPGAEYYTLEWVGLLSGKRENRRFMGDYVLDQEDIVSQKKFSDAVSYGGWAIDHHPSDGVFSSYDACYQWHIKGVYSIPFRTMYSKNIQNLLLAGRLISVSPVVYGSTRVMMTSAHSAQAVGVASVLCLRNDCTPHKLAKNPDLVNKLQQYLLRDGQYIPEVASYDPAVNKACSADIEVSSEWQFNGFAPNGDLHSLDCSVALLFPLKARSQHMCSVYIMSEKKQTITVFFMKADKLENYIPERVMDSVAVKLVQGEHRYDIPIQTKSHESGYYFLVIPETPLVAVRRSLAHIPGTTTVYHKFNSKVAKSAYQQAPEGSGIESFPLWTPYRPEAQYNIACEFSEALPIFSASQLQNGYHRPVYGTNCWVPELKDEKPHLLLRWKEPKEVGVVLFFFDGAFDCSLEAIQMEQPWSVTPACVQSFTIYNHVTGKVLHKEENNYLARKKVVLPEKVVTNAIRIEFCQTSKERPVVVYGVQCF